MIESAAIPLRVMPSGLCEDTTGEATALLARMARGDGAALDELYRMWSPILTGIATRTLHDPREAENAVQETFIRMWRHSSEFDPHEWRPFVWAFDTLRNICIDRLHKHRRKKHQAPPADSAAPPPPAETMALPGAMAAADWQRVRSALDQLDLDERGFLEHAVFLEYLHPVAANHHGPSTGAVRIRLRSALDKLCHQLSRYEL